MVEEMSHSTIEEAVELHMECFKDSFLASLDRHVLTRMYDNYVTSELGRAYIYVKDGEIIGLVAGVINPSVYYNQMMKKSGVHVLWSVVKRAFRNPKILVSMARRDLSGFFRPDESEDAYRKATLDVICVKQEYRGEGIAQQLAQVFFHQLRESGVLNISLGVSPENASARRFYEKIGLEYLRTEEHPDGEQVCIYGRAF